MQRLSNPVGSSSPAQIDAGASSGGGSGAELTATEFRLFDDILEKEDGDERTFVGAGALAECAHGSDDDVGVVESEDIDSIQRGTQLATAADATVPGNGSNPEESHAVAHAGISFTYDGTQWRFDEPSALLPPTRVRANEVEAGEATASAVSLFVEAGQEVEPIEKTDDGSARVAPGDDESDLSASLF